MRWLLISITINTFTSKGLKRVRLTLLKNLIYEVLRCLLIMHQRACANPLGVVERKWSFYEGINWFFQIRHKMRNFLPRRKRTICTMLLELTWFKSQQWTRFEKAILSLNKKFCFLTYFVSKSAFVETENSWESHKEFWKFW